MNPPALGWVFLVVASMNLATYTVVLVVVRRPPRRPGLVRTATSRVLVALCYIGVATATIVGWSHLDTLVVTVLIVVSLTWQVNSLLDGRLAHHPPHPRRVPAWAQSWEFLHRNH